MEMDDMKPAIERENDDRHGDQLRQEQRKSEG